MSAITEYVLRPLQTVFSIGKILVGLSVAAVVLILSSHICLKISFIETKPTAKSEPETTEEHIPYMEINLHTNLTNVSHPDFEYFSDSNNETGYDDFIVPNIIHFIRMNQTYVPFHEMISIKAAYLNHNPDKIMIHCDNCSLYGKYWEIIKNIDTLTLVQFQTPTVIFGQNFSSLFHAGDIARNIVLRKYGGIFLDNDVYVVRSLNKFRKFEMVIGWDDGCFLGTQIQIAHPNARFLKYYYETYRYYNGKEWYYNAGELPTKMILNPFPQLVHRVKIKFGVHMWIIPEIFERYWGGWEELYTVHTFIRLWYAWHPKLETFDEDTIRDWNNTFSAMARLIYYGKKDLLPGNGRKTGKIVTTLFRDNFIMIILLIVVWVCLCGKFYFKIKLLSRTAKT